MTAPLPISELIHEWISWAAWVQDPDRDESRAGEFIGFDEFEWITREHPEHAWQGILAALQEPKAEKSLGILAAGPIEDLLSNHGHAFIDRVEAEARANAKFAAVLGGVWRSQMPEDIWCRVQAVWDSRGWQASANTDG